MTMVKILLSVVLLIGCVQVPPKEYFGDWYVVQPLHTSGVSALSDSEAHSLIGRRVSYGPQAMRSGATQCERPRYDEVRYSQDEFLAANRIGAREIGITDDFIFEVDVRQESGSMCSGIGRIFFVKDATMLVVMHEGVYFEMRRSSPSIK